MSRERDIYRQMQRDAQESINGSQPVYEVKPFKTNYLSAIIWTSVVAAIVCSIFMGILLYLVNVSNIESDLENAANHAVYNLEQIVKRQNSDIVKLREENKKIYDYLNLWTPIDCRQEIDPQWIIPGNGLPAIPKRYDYYSPLCE